MAGICKTCDDNFLALCVVYNLVCITAVSQIFRQHGEYILRGLSLGVFCAAITCIYVGWLNAETFEFCSRHGNLNIYGNINLLYYRKTFFEKTG